MGLVHRGVGDLVLSVARLCAVVIDKRVLLETTPPRSHGHARRVRCTPTFERARVVR